MNLLVSISHEEWCWKHKSVEVDVLDADVLGVEFRQIGYILRCSLSHAITLVSIVFLQAGVMAAKPSFLFDFQTESVFPCRNSSKMAANLKTWAFTTSPRESTASASPSLVSFSLLTSH